MKSYTAKLESVNMRRNELKLPEQDLEEELRIIKEKQKDIEQEYQRLDTEERAIKNEYTAQNCVFAPFRNVNDDILQEISVACTGKPTSRYRFVLPLFYWEEYAVVFEISFLRHRLFGQT